MRNLYEVGLLNFGFSLAARLPLPGQCYLTNLKIDGTAYWTFLDVAAPLAFWRQPMPFNQVGDLHFPYGIPVEPP